MNGSIDWTFILLGLVVICGSISAVFAITMMVIMSRKLPPPRKDQP